MPLAGYGMLKDQSYTARLIELEARCNTIETNIHQHLNQHGDGIPIILRRMATDLKIAIDGRNEFLYSIPYLRQLADEVPDLDTLGHAPHEPHKENLIK